jgi:hypothetical protein
MKRRYLCLGLLVLPMLLLNVPSVLAETVDFDDLDPFYSDGYPVPAGYAGLTWVNFNSMYVPSYHGDSIGYVTGMASEEFVVYNFLGGAAEFSSSEPFTFVGAYLTAAWFDGLEITVDGYVDSQLVYTSTVRVSPTVRQYFTFDYKGVTRVTFIPSGGTLAAQSPVDRPFFVLDNLEITGGDPEADTITIDIKPEDKQNVVNPKSKGVIPVAILTTDTFDAATVDPSSAYFGPTGVEALELKAALEDVDGDGRLDMLLFYATQQTGIQCGDSACILNARTTSGAELQGTDSIRTVPCK